MRLTAEDLHEQLTWHWEAQLRPRFEGLTDSELLWEPVPGCWTVRGGQLDGSWPTPSPAPVTTIGGRLGHLGATLADRASAHFGDRTWVSSYPSTAREALAFVDRAYTAWTAGVLGADETRFERRTRARPDRPTSTTRCGRCCCT